MIKPRWKLMTTMIAAGFLAAVVLSAAAGPPPAAGDDDAARIKELEAKVKQLEKSVADLQLELTEIKRSSPGGYFALPRNAAGVPPRVPDTWKPFDFNGQQYFLVPLSLARDKPVPETGKGEKK